MTSPASIPALFADLAGLSDPAGKAVIAGLSSVVVPAGTTVLHQGDRCANYLLVVSGSVKVFTRAENGRELVLYRIAPGGSCILTTACLLSDGRFPAEAVTETDTEALLLPDTLFQRGLGESPGFRRFVFNAYAQRTRDLILLVEQVAFGRVNARLAALLLRRGDAVVTATHQELAMELGTAREVVSRQLKEFEQQGWLALSRGRIELHDRQSLAAVAAEGNR